MEIKFHIDYDLRKLFYKLSPVQKMKGPDVSLSFQSSTPEPDETDHVVRCCTDPIHKGDPISVQPPTIEAILIS